MVAIAIATGASRNAAEIFAFDRWKVTPWLDGFGRPQGLAFDAQGLMTDDAARAAALHLPKQAARLNRPAI